MRGRFAPSPTGRLHLGNLRTALLAWLFARSAGSPFLVRMEDLDRGSVREEHYATQLDDLSALGLDWDGDVVRQSERSTLYDAAVERLIAAGLTYECWCSRKEIQEASSAPHGPPGAYPGTCREGGVRRPDRSPALRLRTGGQVVAVEDRLLGRYEGAVDDFVLRRGDGTAAYNLAVVVDDADQGVEEVVRAADLLPSTPRQVLLARLLDLPVPAYAHVPLVLGPGGERLAKRDGAVTLEDRVALGESSADVVRRLAASLGLDGDTPTALLPQFDPARLPREPWVFTG
ncbi:MAG: earS, partial [Actinomycetia bacterium]|nr:earS [Actinomycetes bacterium]